MSSSDVDRSPSHTSRRRRTLFLDRLDSLFSSKSKSIGPPLSKKKSSEETSAAAIVTVTRTPGGPAPPQMLKHHSSRSSASRMPTLRWFDSKPSTSDVDVAEVQEPVINAPKSNEEHSATLQEAIQEKLPVKPPRAKIRAMPSSSYNPFGPPLPFRQPSLMNSLARATLPSHASSGIEATSNFPLITAKNKRTSLDSLKTLSNREKHTSASASPSASSSSPSSEVSTNFTRSWLRWDNKRDVDALLDESDRAETPRREAEQISLKYLTPRNPVVFCHGLLGFDSIKLGASFAPVQVSHWRGIKEVLEANGVEVLITRVPATSSIQERAKVLVEKISQVYAGREVHLIGHSMGGLDCRYLTSHLEKPFKVLSITTIATPHRGSAFAEHFIQTIGRERLPSVVSLLDLLPNGGGDGKAFESLVIENMRQFNEETPDVEGVKYFSWGATYTPGLIDTWRWPHSVIMEKEGLNDGLVSVESSKWGTYLGTLENVSHLDMVGWVNAARYKWAALTGREIAFKPGTFYLGVTDHLARAVEGQAVGEPSVIGDQGIEGVDTSPAEHAAQQEQIEASESQGGEDKDVGVTKTGGKPGEGPNHDS